MDIRLLLFCIVIMSCSMNSFFVSYVLWINPFPHSESVFYWKPAQQIVLCKLYAEASSL